MPVVLFTKTRSSNYLQYGVDCWDEFRDARNYRGNDVVIAHPPCRLWAGMKHFSTASEEEKELAVFALDLVRRNGGVLEHPIKSDLFKGNDFMPPGRMDKYGGWLLKVHLNWFGFAAKKSTYLYIVGCPPGKIPPYPMSFDAITHVIGTSAKKVGCRYKEMNKSDRDVTPPKMCEWLIMLAREIERRLSPLE